MVFQSSFPFKTVDYRGLDEWYEANKERLKSTNILNRESNATRQRSQELRDKAVKTTEWHQRETSNALVDRKTDTGRWLEIIQTARKYTEDQLKETNWAKKCVERALQDKGPYLTAVRQCLEIRDQRRDIDLVRDDVHTQLELEHEFLIKSKEKLSQKSQELWDLNFKLNESLHVIQTEEKNKMFSFQRDDSLLQLTSGANISRKPAAGEPAKCIVSERRWVEQVNARITQNNEIVESSREMVSSAHCLIHQQELELNQEREKTQALKRKRIQEIEAERDMLNFQINQIESEIPILHQEISESQTLLNSTNMPLKLAQTRLENRKWSRKSEIANDLPHNVLLSEVETTENNRTELDRQLQQSKKNLYFLREQLYSITKALEIKEMSLKLENKSMHTHKYTSLPKLNVSSLKIASSDMPIKLPASNIDSGLLEEFYNNLKLESETSLEKTNETEIHIN